jgi:hypothetical protein
VVQFVGSGNPDEIIISYGGGGGADYNTANNILEILLQLSFCYDEIDLSTAFILPSGLNIKKLLEEFLKLPSDRNIKDHPKQIALCLINRLSCFASKRLANQGGGDLLNKPKKEITQQHIMLSYFPTINKTLVINLGE